MAKRKNNSNANIAWAVAVVAVVAAAASVFMLAYGGAEQPDAKALSSDAGIGKIVDEFHADNSEANIATYLPDAEIVFRENRTDMTNTTLEFRYYYSQAADKTVVACARNATLAVCPGRVTEGLGVQHLNDCIIHPSIVLNIAESS